MSTFLDFVDISGGYVTVSTYRPNVSTFLGSIDRLVEPDLVLVVLDLRPNLRRPGPVRWSEVPVRGLVLILLLIRLGIS